MMCPDKLVVGKVCDVFNLWIPQFEKLYVGFTLRSTVGVRFTVKMGFVNL